MIVIFEEKDKELAEKIAAENGVNPQKLMENYICDQQWNIADNLQALIDYERYMEEVEED